MRIHIRSWIFALIAAATTAGNAIVPAYLDMKSAQVVDVAHGSSDAIPDNDLDDSEDAEDATCSHGIDMSISESVTLRVDRTYGLHTPNFVDLEPQISSEFTRPPLQT